MAYSDKNRQREANRLASKRRRDKQKGMTQGMTHEGMTQGKVIPQTITDAAGKEHLIDFEGRCRDKELLDKWARWHKDS